jgi:hypothetical protein
MGCFPWVRESLQRLLMHRPIIRKVVSQDTLFIVVRHKIVVEEVPTRLLFIDHVAQILNVLFRLRGNLLGSLGLRLSLLDLKQR